MTTIAQERAGLAAVGWRLRRREEWGARRSYTDARAVTEPATRAFVHITITNPSNYSSDDAHARAVEAIGIARFPNTGISYNRLIFQSGAAYEGQPVGRRGAHTVNDEKVASCVTTGCPGRGGPLTAPDWNLNVNSRAYVICQNVGDAVTDRQLDSLARAIAADKLVGFVVRTAEIHGHRCVSAKSCPGGLMWARMFELEEKVNHYVRVGLQPEPAPEPARKAVHMFVTRYGSSQYRLVTGDRMVAVAQSTYDKLKAAGVPAVALDNAEVAALQEALVAENLPALEEPPA